MSHYNLPGGRRTADVPRLRVDDYGSLCVVVPLDPEATRWLAETAPGGSRWLWCQGLVVEPRYVAGVVEAARAAGVEVL